MLRAAGSLTSGEIDAVGITGKQYILAAGADLSDITKVLADEKVNILSASVQTAGDDRVAISRFTFEMADPKHLGHVLGAVRKVEGVFDVYRMTSN